MKITDTRQNPQYQRPSSVTLVIPFYMVPNDQEQETSRIDHDHMTTAHEV
jgi:hypothetical protein